MGKCLIRTDIPRFLGVALVLVFLVWRTKAADNAILPPDAAARAYELGREAVRKKDYVAGIQRLTEALATGHTRPAVNFGTSRNFVDWYDPYYWLGVAYMELGNEAEALVNFRRSREAGVIERSPEFASLLERIATLEKHEAERRRLPEVAPTPVLVVNLPTPTPAPPPTMAPPPLPAPDLAETPTPEVTPAPSPRPTPDPAELTPALAALSAGQWEAAETALARYRERHADAVEADLVETVLYGTRYLLEGKKDPALLAKAKARLASFRQRGGSKKAEESWISPSLAAALKE
jgi:tetratricopeptide (TPR) repeat protein